MTDFHISSLAPLSCFYASELRKLGSKKRERDSHSGRRKLCSKQPHKASHSQVSLMVSIEVENVTLGHGSGAIDWSLMFPTKPDIGTI